MKAMRWAEWVVPASSTPSAPAVDPRRGRAIIEAEPEIIPGSPHWKTNVEVQIDEIGPIVATLGTYDEDGKELTPPVMVAGHHFNIRAHGAFARKLVAGLEQTDAKGDTRPFFDRTTVKGDVEKKLRRAQKLEVKTAEGVPAGYEDSVHKVRLFDPALINSRSRVWA